jgi:hypothetical protein
MWAGGSSKIRTTSTRLHRVTSPKITLDNIHFFRSIKIKFSARKRNLQINLTTVLQWYHTDVKAECLALPLPILKVVCSVLGPETGYFG